MPLSETRARKPPRVLFVQDLMKGAPGVPGPAFGVQVTTLMVGEETDGGSSR